MKNNKKKIALVLALTGLLATGTVSAYAAGKIGNPDVKISVEQAKKIALDNSRDGVFKSIDLERRNGILVYDVDILEPSFEKEYKINAATGAILFVKQEVRDFDDYDDLYPAGARQGGAASVPAVSGQAPSAGSVNKNPPVSTPGPGVPGSGAAVGKTPAPVPAPAPAGQTRVYHGSDYDSDYGYYGYGSDYAGDSNYGMPGAGGNVSAPRISPEEAGKIALNTAGGGFLKSIQLDREYGTLLYEAEVLNGNVEKEYKIDAQTGAILHAKESREHFFD